MFTEHWFIVVIILWFACFATMLAVQNRPTISLRAAAKFLVGLPITLLFAFTLGLFVVLLGNFYLGDGAMLSSVQKYVQESINRSILVGSTLETAGISLQQEAETGQEEVIRVESGATPPKAATTIATSLVVAQVSNLEPQQAITLTITPEVIFATATAVKIATLTAQAQATVTPAATLTPTNTVVADTATPAATATATPTAISTLAAISTAPPTSDSTNLDIPISDTPISDSAISDSAETDVAPTNTDPVKEGAETVIATGIPSTETPKPLNTPIQRLLTPTPIVDIADMPALTATALDKAAQTTVEAILTRVDNPNLPFEEFTATPTPVVITATPTPGDIFFAATAAAEKTALAAVSGTATQTPENWKVVTPVYVVSTPTPENAATASYQSALATAQVVTTGTPDPYRYVVVIELVTATPTATSLVAAAQTLAAATIQATTTGTPTPTPRNWRVVTPVVVTATATPANALTAEAQNVRATAAAVLTATPPWHMLVVTATATPPFILIEDPVELLNLEHRGPAYAFPAQLLGKILFRSDVSGQEEIYAINPDGSGLAQLPDTRAYRLAEARDAYSADGLSRAYALRDSHNRLIQIHYESFEYQTTRAWSAFGSGIAWAPAWSPTAAQVAFVSNHSGNDEIWIMGKDEWPATKMTENEWEWDKHPSWSPDGSTIVFASNRIEGNRQLWLMDADGSNQRQLTGFELPLQELGHLFSDLVFEAWDPVWVKYPDPYIQVSREQYLARPECVVCLPINQ